MKAGMVSPAYSQVWGVSDLTKYCSITLWSSKWKEKLSRKLVKEICPFYQGHVHTRTGGNCFLKQLANDCVAIVIIKMSAQSPGGSPGCGAGKQNTPG